MLDFDFNIKRPLTETLSDIALGGAMGGGMAEAYAGKTDQMTHYGKHFIDKALSGKYGAIQVRHAQQDVQYFYQRLHDEVIAKGYDAFLAPTMPTSHVPADYDFTQDEALSEDGITFPKAAGMQYTLPWNFLNWNPVLNVPVGLSDQNMPIGMQIIGKPYDLEAVFRVGKAFSKGGLKLYTGDMFPKIQ